jgi:hypothetical protein
MRASRARSNGYWEQHVSDEGRGRERTETTELSHTGRRPTLADHSQAHHNADTPPDLNE